MVNVSKKESNSLIKIIKGSIIAVIITIFLLIIFSAILTYTNVGESTIPTVIIIISSISILIGSQISTSKIKKNGILNGCLIGIIYILFLYVISSILIKRISLNSYSILMIATSILLGGMGGIIGVNRK